jgi:hypothetical protein
MYDTNSFLFPGLIIIGIIFAIAIIIFLFLKKKINIYLSLVISFLVLGIIFNHYHLLLFRDIFLLCTLIFLILFIIGLFKKRVKK